MRFTSLILILTLVCISCGPRSAAEAAREMEKQTELVIEGGASPFQATLSFLSPEVMAIQEVPYQQDEAAWVVLQRTVSRYRNQMTLRLSIGPKQEARLDPRQPFALDIENNGGQWNDHGRNLQRLMFEMGPFIRLVSPDGKEIEPRLVEFQRSFGIGRERSFLLVFPVEYEGKPLFPPFELRVMEFGQGMGLLRFQIKKTPSGMTDREIRRLWVREFSAR